LLSRDLREYNSPNWTGRHATGSARLIVRGFTPVEIERAHPAGVNIMQTILAATILFGTGTVAQLGGPPALGATITRGKVGEPGVYGMTWNPSLASPLAPAVPIGGWEGGSPARQYRLFRSPGPAMVFGFAPSTDVYTLWVVDGPMAASAQRLKLMSTAPLLLNGGDGLTWAISISE
jgi:hypothetical protein